MKILLDENLPVKLKLSFANDHEIRTVGKMGWAGKRNGELLRLMVLGGFDAFITIDKNLQYQQNISRYPIRLFILDAPDNKLNTLTPYVERLASLLSNPPTEMVFTISLG